VDRSVCAPSVDRPGPVEKDKAFARSGTGAGATTGILPEGGQVDGVRRAKTPAEAVELALG
jgi:hypothetical protein